MARGFKVVTKTVSDVLSTISTTAGLVNTGVGFTATKLEQYIEKDEAVYHATFDMVVENEVEEAYIESLQEKAALTKGLSDTALTALETFRKERAKLKVKQ